LGIEKDAILPSLREKGEKEGGKYGDLWSNHEKNKTIRLMINQRIQEHSRSRKKGKKSERWSIRRGRLAFH